MHLSSKFADLLAGAYSKDQKLSSHYKDAANNQVNSKSPISTTLALSRRFLPSLNATASLNFPNYNSSMIVGGSWIMGDLTTVKARFDDHGKMMTLLQHKIKPQSCLTLASEFDTKALDKIPGIGLALTLVL
ncbi:hypothetical protein DKX38_014217 [Salix brachista]|uniref:Uncharacterized protein n=1 Tax=Salix brachista TaxID=2182728 RepID=A0A5N5LEN0_9ROSI|nr:hypothetical protein DKX38_014217 [Salix brachista]